MPPTKLPKEKYAQMKKNFDRYQKSCVKHASEERQFHKQCEEVYGNTMYNDVDADEFIDALDYGMGGTKFKDFNKLMLEINSEDDES